MDLQMPVSRLSCPTCLAVRVETIPCVHLQIKDGLATTTAIRRMEVKGPISSRIPVQLNGRLPILAVSAQIDLVGGPKLVKTGFDGVVEKPVNFDRLRSMLAGVVDPGCRQDMYWRFVWCSPSGGRCIADHAVNVQGTSSTYPWGLLVPRCEAQVDRLAEQACLDVA